MAFTLTPLPIPGRSLLSGNSISLSVRPLAAAPVSPVRAIQPDQEVTRVMPALAERTIVESTPLPVAIAADLLSYEKMRVTREEIVSFCDWLNEKRLRVGFMTKAVEYLIQMRAEIQMEEEVTRVIPRPEIRRAG